MPYGKRETDQVFRFGGEEFVLLLSDTSEENAPHLANQLQQKLADTPVASLGTLVAATHSKREGRNRTVAAKISGAPHQTALQAKQAIRITPIGGEADTRPQLADPSPVKFARALKSHVGARQTRQAPS